MILKWKPTHYRIRQRHIIELKNKHFSKINHLSFLIFLLKLITILVYIYSALWDSYFWLTVLKFLEKSLSCLSYRFKSNLDIAIYRLIYAVLSGPETSKFALIIIKIPKIWIEIEFLRKWDVMWQNLNQFY
jgi:hypothetical protein